MKLRWLKRGIPAVRSHGEAPPKLEIAQEDSEEETTDPLMSLKDPENEADSSEEQSKEEAKETPPKKVVQPPKEDVYEWQWKVRTSTN
jgi:ribosome production factor 1